MTDFADRYEAGCKAAAHDQGLDPLTAALSARKVAHFVEQTGGFTMVLTISRADGTWGITNDGKWWAVWYPGEMWQEGDFVDINDPAFEDVTDDDLETFIDKVLAAH